MNNAIKRHRLVLRRKPLAFFLRAGLDTVFDSLRREPSLSDFEDARWPAHLHINIVPEYRGTGTAEALMNPWKKRLCESGSPGCYLQTLVENVRAVRFFERMSFIKHGLTPLIPGVRYQGKRVHQQTMVWTRRRTNHEE